MEWKSYPIYPDYEVSTEGQVRRIKDGKLLKQYPQKSGYVAVFINTGRGYKPMPVHTIVAETFLERLPHQDRVDHINTIRSDNRIANLRWADAKENANNPTTRVNMSKARHKNREHF